VLLIQKQSPVLTRMNPGGHLHLYNHSNSGNTKNQQKKDISCTLVSPTTGSTTPLKKGIKFNFQVPQIFLIEEIPYLFGQKELETTDNSSNNNTIIPSPPLDAISEVCAILIRSWQQFHHQGNEKSLFGSREMDATKTIENISLRFIQNFASSAVLTKGSGYSFVSLQPISSLKRRYYSPQIT
jgi:hypothetical protein